MINYVCINLIKYLYNTCEIDYVVTKSFVMS